MILEAILPCACLLLTSGWCIYALRNHSLNRYSALLPHFVSASIGITAIWIRSFMAVIYKTFLKTYNLDPELIELAEADDKLIISVLDQILNTAITANLNWSVYCHHGYCIIGTCVVLSISSYDIVNLKRAISASREVTTEQHFLFSYTYRISETAPKILPLLWITSNGVFTLFKNNNYGLLSNFPYGVTTLLPVEGFHQGWSINRAISDYMMVAYIVLITEALRQT